MTERRPLRPIHYLGSKLRLLDAIGAAVDLVDPDRGPAIDLFSGSGVVAAHLAEERSVVAVDIQEYARVLSSALLAGNQLTEADVTEVTDNARASEQAQASGSLGCLLEHEAGCQAAVTSGDLEPLAAVVEAGALIGFERGEGPGAGALADALREASLGSTPGVITRYYGGVYFSYRQALQLDGLAEQARAVDPGDRDAVLAAVLGAASEAVSTVGSHFAQPVRPRDGAGQPKGPLLRSVARKREIDVIDAFERWAGRLIDAGTPPNAGTAVRGDYREFLASHSKDVSVVYADPPYTRDHYSRFYHVLETLALGDTPGLSTTNLDGGTRLSRGLYRAERHQSPFCIRSQAPDAFRELFKGVRRLRAPLVLSYSPYTQNSSDRPRVLTVGQVVDLARRCFRAVEVTSAGRLAHSKFNVAHRNTDISYDAEVLVVCRP